MGEATAWILVDVGAEVIGFDVKPTAVPVAEFVTVDLHGPGQHRHRRRRRRRRPDRLGVQRVAGLPWPPFSDLDTVLVNFVGARHLIESLVPSMPAGASAICVASNAGLGWQQDLEWLVPAVSTDGFEAGSAWCRRPTRLDRQRLRALQEAGQRLGGVAGRAAHGRPRHPAQLLQPGPDRARR